MPRHQCLCVRELPGLFHTCEPGILAAIESDRVAPDAVVERCDQCRRYPTDDAALARLYELGLAEPGAAAEPTFTVHCYAVVRVKFPGVVAKDAPSAAQQVRDRFDWDTHREQAEFADEIQELLVDSDADPDFRGSLRFSADLVEFDAPPVRAHVTAQPSPRRRMLLRGLQPLLTRFLAFWRHRFESYDPPVSRQPTADPCRTHFPAGRLR
jgi:hypothetical protein